MMTNEQIDNDVCPPYPIELDSLEELEPVANIRDGVRERVDPEPEPEPPAPPRLPERSLIPGVRMGVAAGGAPIAPLLHAPPLPPPARAPARPAAGVELAPVLPAGSTGVPAPYNRFLVQVHKGLVRVRGLPIGSLSATEARAFAAWLLMAADQVAIDGDQDFQDLYSALLRGPGAEK